jgi:hypothetical protein
VGLILAFFIPRELGGQSDKPNKLNSFTIDAHTKKMGWTGLIALFLFGVSVNVVYGYVERVGLSNGLDQVGITNALALGYIFAAFGSAIPLIFGAVGGRLKWIAFTTLLLFGSLAALYMSGSVLLYTVAFGVYTSTWSMGLAYYMSFTAENDPEEQFTRMMYIVTVAAQSIGPAIAAAALTEAPLSAVFVIAPGPALLAVILVVVVSAKTRKIPGVKRVEA